MNKQVTNQCVPIPQNLNLTPIHMICSNICKLTITKLYVAIIVL